jgi:Tfp pilus assembly protein PilO
MNKNRLWVVGTSITIVVIIGGGWLFGIQPQMSVIASDNQMRASVQVQNSLNEVLLAKLKRDYQGIIQLRQQLDSLRSAIPASEEIPAFVTELNTLAKKYGVTIKSISVSDAKPYSPLVSPAGGASSTITNPKITPANFVLIPIQLTVSGPYAKVLEFVHQVQIGSRLFFVSMLSSSGSTDTNGTPNSRRPTPGRSEQVDASVGGLVYVLLNGG